MIVASTLFRPPAGLGEQGEGRAQQPPAVGAAIARVAVGEMAADVAQRRRAEQRIGDRVQQRVGVRMTEQAERVRDVDATEDQPAAGNQRVNVATLADADHSSLLALACRIISCQVQVGRIGHLEIARIGAHQPGLQTGRFDRRCFVGAAGVFGQRRVNRP
jgi:hypothetical protein